MNNKLLASVGMVWHGGRIAQKLSRISFGLERIRSSGTQQSVVARGVELQKVNSFRISTLIYSSTNNGRDLRWANQEERKQTGK